MTIQTLELVNFRNYNELKIKFFPGCNILFGENAQGKTNLLESIFYLCFSRSFRTLKDQDVIYFEKLFTRIHGQFLLDRNIEQNVQLCLNKGETKSILLEQKKVNRYSELIGKFPVVFLGPDNYKITSDGPIERRRLIDMFLSQVSSAYLKNLQKYNRILKQRNKILFELNNKINFDAALLEPWNHTLVECGSFLIKSRHFFITEFNPLLAKIYTKLNLSKETLSFSYKPSFSFTNENDIQASFLNKLHRDKTVERVRGLTISGPHRDDFVFKIENKDLRLFGSRGQHKSVLTALKFAEFFYLKKKKEETPILLLDDLFSDLDYHREKQILEIIQNLGQTFITTTKKISKIHPDLKQNEYLVQDGAIKF
jgi:DNA replication and repair protein RecF